MIDRKYLKAIAGIFVLFAIGLVFFFIFSAPYGDGLEKTMEEAGIEEGEPVYQAPLNYGEDYVTALIAGIVGFGLTIGMGYGFFKLTRKKEEIKETK